MKQPAMFELIWHEYICIKGIWMHKSLTDIGLRSNPHWNIREHTQEAASFHVWFVTTVGRVSCHQTGKRGSVYNGWKDEEIAWNSETVLHQQTTRFPEERSTEHRLRYRCNDKLSHHTNLQLECPEEVSQPTSTAQWCTTGWQLLTFLTGKSTSKNFAKSSTKSSFHSRWLIVAWRESRQDATHNTTTVFAIQVTISTAEKSGERNHISTARCFEPEGPAPQTIQNSEQHQHDSWSFKNSFEPNTKLQNLNVGDIRWRI